MPEHPAFSLIIGYASDMGTAEYIAMQLADAVKAFGVDVTETELNDIALDDLNAATHFVLVASTFGEGEVPDNGTVFWEELSASEARFDCYREGDAREWLADIAKMIEEASTAAPGRTSPAPVAPRPTTIRHLTPWTDANPYRATAVMNSLLTAPESDREVRHIELDLGDSGITYDAGDSVAVHPVNAPELVEAMLAKLGSTTPTSPPALTCRWANCLPAISRSAHRRGHCRRWSPPAPRMPRRPPHCVPPTRRWCRRGCTAVTYWTCSSLPTWRSTKCWKCCGPYSFAITRSRPARWPIPIGCI